MGDRANVKVVESGEAPDRPIYFYTHWGGFELPETLRKALVRGRGRWGDAPYLNRIIFSEMIQNQVLGETGFGISVCLGDGHERILEVDHDQETVTVINSYSGKPEGKTYTFQEYIDAGPKEWPEYGDPI